ncbi:MAG TPA: hypothetical protein VGP64_09955 [Polyangia bacterium]
MERPRPADRARPRSFLTVRAASAVCAALVGVGATVGCASAPPPAPVPGAWRPVGNAYVLGATLPPAEAADEVAYYRERAAALAAPTNVEIARTDFARLRRGRLYLTQGLRDRETAELGRRLTTAFSGGDGPQVLDLTGQILARDQTDIRAHALRGMTLRRGGRTIEADAQHEIVISLVQSIVQGGDGLGFTTAWTVFDPNEEYEVLRVEGCMPRSQGQAPQGDRWYDVVHARRFSDGSPCDAYFDVTEMMAVAARRFPARPR